MAASNEGNKDPGTGQKTAQLFTREPVMLTLPFAYGLALIVWKFPGGAWSTNNWSALITAFVLSVIVYFLDRYSTEDKWTENEVRIRYVYIVLNTIILTGLLTGLTTIDKLSGIIDGG